MPFLVVPFQQENTEIMRSLFGKFSSITDNFREKVFKIIMTAGLFDDLQNYS